MEQKVVLDQSKLERICSLALETQKLDTRGEGRFACIDLSGEFLAVVRTWMNTLPDGRVMKFLTFALCHYDPERSADIAHCVEREIFTRPLYNMYALLMAGGMKSAELEAIVPAVQAAEALYRAANAMLKLDADLARVERKVIPFDKCAPMHVEPPHAESTPLMSNKGGVTLLFRDGHPVSPK